jgi:integrase
VHATFRVAATKYLNENQHKRRIADEARHVKQLDPFIGNLPIESVHMGTLQPFIEARRKQGIKTKSINLALGVVRHVLNLAASEWLDESNLTWLQSAPKIKLMPVTDARKPYPLSWEEQTLLFQALPSHLARMALFKVNTGTREQEVCRLRWDWEVPVPAFDTSVFIIPGERVKNGEDRLVVLNRVAKSVIDEVRGEHPEFVFTYRGHPVTSINNTAWKNARKRTGLTQVRVHDRV